MCIFGVNLIPYYHDLAYDGTEILQNKPNFLTEFRHLISVGKFIEKNFHMDARAKMSRTMIIIAGVYHVVLFGAVSMWDSSKQFVNQKFCSYNLISKIFVSMNVKLHILWIVGVWKHSCTGENIWN